MRIGLDQEAGSTGQPEVMVSPRMQKAACEFEALMMKELLKPMTSQSVVADTADNSEGSTGALGEFASEALAQAISRHGGFGIANRILGELSSPAHSSGTGKTAKNTSEIFPLRLGQ